MKYMIRCRKPAVIILALILALSCACAAAEGSATAPAAGSDTVARLLEINDFKFFVREDGIGRGSPPVYTAPSEDSVRLADGKASFSAKDAVAVAGYTADSWLMVRYEIGKKDEKNKKARVGYVPPKYARTFHADIGKITFESFPSQLAEEIEITDNPRDNHTPYGTLPAGTEITILAKYTYSGNWWYVETTLDGQLTRGFIDRGKAAIVIDGVVYHGNAEMGYPVSAPDGTPLMGMITVKGKKSDAMIVRKRAGTDSPMIARVHGGDVYPCYGSASGKGSRIWYFICVDGVWGWFAGGNATFTEGE